MSCEDSPSEAETGEETKLENGTNLSEQCADTLKMADEVHVPDSEDEHFEEAQPERSDDLKHEDDVVTSEKHESHNAQPEEKENKVVEEPAVVEERLIRNQVENEQSEASAEYTYSEEKKVTTLDNDYISAPQEFNKEPELNGRVVSNAIPTMNSHGNDRYDAVINELTALTTRETEKCVTKPTLLQRRTNPPQSSIYHRNPPERKVVGPAWYSPPEKPVTNIIPAPPAYEQPVQQSVQNLNNVQHHSVSSPTRKISNNTPYVGSHVIASETGPSLTVFLRRPTSERQWGFSFYGGAEFGCPPFVNKVNKNSLALQHGVEVGDVIVSICKTLTVGKTHDQLKAEMLRAGNELDLVLIRKGVDLQKLTQLVPQVFQNAPKSPPSSVSYGSNEYVNTESTRVRSGQSLTRGRSFRSIKTKSIRILEEQLSSGQNPSSVVASKQHFQGARGLPSGGTMSSYTTAYGQQPNQGYSGRQVIIQPSYTGPVSASNDYHHQYANQSYMGGQYADGGRGAWDSRSDYGMSGGNVAGYSPSSSPYGQQLYHSPSQVSPGYAQPATQTSSASITVPVHGRKAWPTQYM